MNLLATLLCSQFMAIASSSMPIALLPADEDSVLLEIGKIIGGAIRGIRGDPEPPRAAVFAQPANNNGPAPSEKDQKECDTRLRAYSNAMQLWLAKTCELTAEQQSRLKELFEVRVAAELTKYSKSQNPQRQNQSFPETFPLLFTKSTGLADRFSSSMIEVIRNELLSNEQKLQLDTALNDRETSRSEAFLAYLVSITDKELYLTSDQRDALIRELSARKKPLQHPLYSFNPQNYYLPYESLSQILPASAGKGFLEPSQKKRLQDLSGNDPNGQHIIFRSESGPEEWYKQLNDAGREQRDRYLRAVAVRITYYEKELALSAPQVQHLTVAGKGAAVRALGDWKESTQQTIDQMEQQMAQMGGNFAFGSQRMDTTAIDQNAIWSDAIESILPGVALERLELRQKANRAAMARALVTLLDEELWLTEEQRKPLLEQIEKTLPAKSDPAQNQEYIREIILMAYPLFRIDEKQLTDILTEPQLEAWKAMTTFFQFQAANNYLQIPMRNGGSFGFMLSN